MCSFYITHAYGARSHSRLRHSVLTPTTLDPLRLLPASSEFPNGAYTSTALDPLREIAPTAC